LSTNISDDDDDDALEQMSAVLYTKLDVGTDVFDEGLQAG